MEQLQSHRSSLAIWIAALLAPVLVALWVFLPRTTAHADNERIITIHYDGQERTVASDARTVGEVLERADVQLHEHDAVEPEVNTELIAVDYEINVYRARPVTVLDGGQRYWVMTPHTSAKKIAEAAGLKVYDEDIFELDRIDDFVAEQGVGLRLTITRSTPIKLMLYGKSVDARTQAKTVGELLKEKKIELGKDDGISPGIETPIAAGMNVAVYRNGVQVTNEEQEVPFETEQIRDADHEVGYKEVREAGVKGKKVVTYQIELRDGKEVGRKEIQSVVTIQPKKQVEVVGTKTTGFSGDFGAALARLRSCEGSYTSVNPVGYYGAYQFNLNTWRGAAPAGYENVRPDQAPPEVQDQAARNLYERRGWQPWPACSRSLGLQDIYR